jgi:chaperonin cofactor prefoldin
MANKYTKKNADAQPSSPADAWKDTPVEKEHQPAKVKSEVSYRQIEAQIESIDAQVKSLGDQKTALEAELAEIKKAVEA